MLSPAVIGHGHEFLRALRQKNFEVTDTGLWFPKQGCHISGMGLMENWLNGEDRDSAPNIVPTEALNYLLTAGVLNGAAIGTWNVALFSGNVTPGLTLTGETFVSVCTEYTAYAETTRQAYVGAAASGGSTDNSASKATFTANGGGGTVYGAAALQSSAKSDATVGNKILCAARFSASRALVATDVLSVQYTLSLTSS